MPKIAHLRSTSLPARLRSTTGESLLSKMQDPALNQSFQLSSSEAFIPNFGIPVVHPASTPSPMESPVKGRRAKFAVAGGVERAAVELWPQAVITIESPRTLVDSQSLKKFQPFDTREDLHDILNAVNICQVCSNTDDFPACKFSLLKYLLNDKFAQVPML